MLRSNVVLAAAALLVAGAACSHGGGGGTTSARASTDESRAADVTLTATEFAFAPDPAEAETGSTTVALVNQGAVQHTLLVEGPGGLKLSVAGRGDRDTGQIHLPPGSYTMYRDVPGHRAAGMESTLKVTEP